MRFYQSHFVTVNQVTQPAPTPRFSRTPSETPRPAQAPGTDTRSTLQAAGFTVAEIDELLKAGAVAQL